MKRIWILGLCLLMAAGVQAQTTYSSSGKAKYNSKNKKQREEGFAQHLIWGGTLGISLGQTTDLSIAPIVGYRVTDNFSVGLGASYEYLNAKDFFVINDANNNPVYYNLKANIFAPSIWARYIVWRNLFAHAEFEYNFMSFKQPGYDQSGSGDIVYQTTKYEAPSILIGPGYRLPMGERSSINFSLLIDVLNNEFSPHGKDPFIRIQFLAGF